MGQWENPDVPGALGTYPGVFQPPGASWDSGRCGRVWNSRILRVPSTQSQVQVSIPALPGLFSLSASPAGILRQKGEFFWGSSILEFHNPVVQGQPHPVKS